MESDRLIREAVWGVARAILHQSRLERNEPPADERAYHNFKLYCAAQQIIRANDELERVFDLARCEARSLAENLDKAIDGPMAVTR